MASNVVFAMPDSDARPVGTDTMRHLSYRQKPLNPAGDSSLLL
jgi:hypothetical protein